MAWESIFREDRCSVGIAPQGSALTTKDTTWEWVVCETPQRTYRPVQSDPARSTRSSGARRGPRPGRLVPHLQIKFATNGQLGAYAYASDTPALKGLMRLLGIADSTQTGMAYQATCYESTASDANTANIKTSTVKLGCLLAFAATDTRLNWVKAVSGSGPWVAELFEDYDVLPTDDAVRLPTRTICPRGETETKGFTIRLSGEHDEQLWDFVGFVPESLAFAVEDDILTCTAMGPCYGGEFYLGTGGGLQPDTTLLTMDAIRDTARYVLGSQSTYDQTFTLANGTADPDGSPDLQNVAWTWTFVHHPLGNPTAIHGVSACTVASPDVTATVSVPDITDYQVGDANILVDAWANENAVSLTCYYGARAGRILAMRIPAGRPTAYPEREIINGIAYRKATLRPDYWGGDGTSPPVTTDCGCKAFTAGYG